MRPIKFRAKGIDNGEWVYGDLIKTHADSICWIGKASELVEVFHEAEQVRPETIDQFTGRTDKHGNDVYDGASVIVTGKQMLSA